MRNDPIRIFHHSARGALLLLSLLLLPLFLPAQRSDSLLDRNKLKYTKERPLIYEGAQDLWPFSYLNEKGEPEGFNIDLIRLIMSRLNIPYEIRMKPRLMAFKDLREGRSDLMIGLTAGFHEEFAHFSDNSVTLFTQSVLSPRSKPTTIRNFRDLANHKVYVNDSSLCHHLMIDYGWEANAIPISTKSSNMAETILQMSTDEEGEMVWNTLSLKWLIRKYQITNLEVTPVNMPHGEYKFMSVDQHLIHLMDSVFTELNAADEILPLQNKWFNPEREEEQSSRWGWSVAVVTAVLLFILIVYTIFYQLQARRILHDNDRRTRRFALILETGGVRLWTYNIRQNQFTWHNEMGLPAYVYSQEEFAKRYSPGDYLRLTEAMNRLAATTPGDDSEITLDIKAQDAREDGDTEMHDFVISLSVLRRDKHGKPTVLIGTKHDVTEKRKQQRQDKERTTRYQAMFNTPMVAILFFGRDGKLQNINDRACEMFACQKDDILTRQMTIQEMLGVEVDDLYQADGLYCTFIMDPATVPASRRADCPCHLKERMCMEFSLMTVDDEDGLPMGLFAICRDVTATCQAVHRIHQCEQQLSEAKAKEDKYIDTINGFINSARLRLLNYSPQSHMLTIYSANEKVQHRLTQTRIMTLVDQEMRKKTMHIIGKMDSHENREFSIDLPTSLRVGGKCLYVHVHLLPQIDDKGQVKEYFGVLRDISEQMDVKRQLKAVEAKTQEVEDAKNSVTKNMMHEIRQPMGAVIENASHLTPEMSHDEEAGITKTIIDNADLLTHIIGNVLNLSRLEAHMVEIRNRPTDFAQIFESCCEHGWEKEKRPEVRYIVENPYEQLVVDIDPENLESVIRQITLNAAQHTHNGVIRARYDYIGRRLVISIEDSGEGMSREKLDALNAQLESGTHTGSGLGLSICKELLQQMDGNLEITSELGQGTAVWVMLPCQAETIKRKKTR